MTLSQTNNKKQTLEYELSRMKSVSWFNMIPYVTVKTREERTF